jgi:hypothetical protein
MPVNTVKSSLVTTHIDSVAGGILNGKHHGNKRLGFSDTLALATGDLEAGDIIALVPLKSSDSVKSIKVFCDDLDGASGFAIDVGLYRILADGTLTATGGDVDCYANASTTGQAANLSGAELGFITRNINKINNEVWADAGLSADVGTHDFVLAITVDTVASTPAAGDITWDVIVARN